MIGTDELVRRNAEFAAMGSAASLRLTPRGSLQVIGCVDPRVDPTLRTLVMLAKVVQANSDGRPRGDFHYVVLQHTGCGIRSLTAFPELLAEYFEVAAGDLEAKAVTDPFAAVRVDVGILRQALAAGVFVSGLVYDVATGLIEIVVPPARVTA
jgi:carbonic anhydrase